MVLNLRQVEALQAKISSYQNVVEKYEKLAEDATTAAIVERKAQLRKLETQLRKREQEAKNKLATAINVIEESQMIDNVIPVISAENSAGDHHAVASAQNSADGDGEQRLSSSTIEPCQSSEINANRLSSSLLNCSNETSPNPDYPSSCGDKLFDSISEPNIDTVLSVKETNIHAMSQKPIEIDASNEQDVIHKTPQALQQKIGEIRSTLKQNVEACSMNSIRSKREKSEKNNIEQMNTDPSVISPKRGRPIKSSPRNPSNQSALKRTISPKVMLTRIKRQENTTDTDTSNENSQLNQNSELHQNEAKETIIAKIEK
jgi:hypothetical protein